MFKKIQLFLFLFITLGIQNSFASVVEFHFTDDIYHLYGIGSNRIYPNSYSVEYQVCNDYGSNTFSDIYSYLVGLNNGARFLSGIDNQCSVNGVSIVPSFWGNTNSGYPIHYPVDSYTDPFNIAGDKFILENGVSYCLYNQNGAISNSYFIPWNAGIPCLSGFSLYGVNYDNYTYVIPSITPPPDIAPPPAIPNIYSVNGMQCSIRKVPDVNSTVWHNFGELPLYVDQSNTGSLQYRWSNTGSITDADIVRYSMINDYGSNIPESSVYWNATTGSTNAVLLGDGELEIRTIQNSQLGGFNIVQIANVALPVGSLVPIRYISTSGNVHEGTTIASGSTLTIGFNELVKSVFLLDNVQRFKGIRTGITTTVDKRFCGNSQASCGWKFIGTDLRCTPLINISGLSQGGCYIAGSGSLYGSGSCVPTVNGSGAVIKHIPASGGIDYIDASGSVTTVFPTVPNSSDLFKNVWTCGLNDADSWYITIGKSIICPIAVIKNLVTVSYDNVSTAVNKLSPLQNSVEKIATATGVTATGSSGSNLNKAFADRLNSIGKTDTWLDKVIRYVWFSLILLVVLFMIGIIISFLRKK